MRHGKVLSISSEPATVVPAGGKRNNFGGSEAVAASGVKGSFFGFSDHLRRNE